MELSNKEKAFIHTVSLYEYGLDLNIIKNIAISDVDIYKLKKLQLIDIYIENEIPITVTLTEKGLRLTDEKYTVLYSVGQNFDEFIKNLTPNAKIKFFHSLIDNDFFDLRYGTFLKNKFVETFVDNDFLNNPLLSTSSVLLLHNYVTSNTNLNILTLYNYIKIYSDQIFTELFTKCKEIENATLNGLMLTDDNLTGFKMLEVTEIKDGSLIFKYNNKITSDYSISVHQAFTIYNYLKTLGKNGVLIL